MIRKFVAIMICLLSLIFISPAEVFPKIQQNSCKIAESSCKIAESNHDNSKSYGEHIYGNTGGFQDLNKRSLGFFKDSGSSRFTSPQQTGINLADANDASSVDNQNVDTLSSGTEHGGQTVGENPSYRFGYNGDSYTINFFNINYGDLFEKRPSRRLIGDECSSYSSVLEDTLKRLAEERRIQEIEQKENLQLLKQIALG
jgi:hypothetical protein